MRIPVATYRLQFHKGFTFRQAMELLPYLRALGISDVYASPLFLAGPESTHGYDICNFNQINPNLGTAGDFEAFTSAIQKLGMGLLVDMVPNHMGIHPSNCWWRDVLTNGRQSPFANHFDINWESPNPLFRGKVLLPVLGDHYGAVLERGELQVVFEKGEFHLAYFDKNFPLSPESKNTLGLLKSTAHAADSRQGLKHLLADINGTSGKPASFDKLHQLIELQHYRLAYWRVGSHEINYRRFFDVTELVSVRVEDENVFQATHKLLLELLHSGKITGLRIDHPDGLRDPKTYFERLQVSGGTSSTSPASTYILAEKILSDEEHLPEDWPIHGTTGYDYLNYLNGLFVEAGNENFFTQIYRRFTGCSEDFESLAFRSKQEVLNRLFISEVNSLTHRLKSIAARTRNGRDFTEAELRAAIIDFIAGFPVYRTYVTESTEELSPAEKEYVQRGLTAAKGRARSTDSRALEFLAGMLFLESAHSDDLKSDAREFVIRFQQLTGPATAKGLEDTAFYRYTRFVSLNEVGGNPGRFGVTPAEFHQYNRYQQEKWPYSMLATSTHDTKRGEDTRARLNVLSEMPGAWEQKVTEWRSMNDALKQGSIPAPPDEYLLYQVLAGTWNSTQDPASYLERIQNYMLKAAREAKRDTTWTEPNDAYESGTKKFIATILNSTSFQPSLASFAAEIAYFGAFNSVAQVILKICSPGVPDFYQGAEHWDLTLVDPDNRRPIDYELRRKLLSEVSSSSVPALMKNCPTGAFKLFTTNRALRIRSEHVALTRGDYTPLSALGAKAHHVIGFARSSGPSTLIIAVPRFIRTLTQGVAIYPTASHWGDTRLEYSGRKRFRNLLTNEELSGLAADELFRIFPAAILLPLD